MAHRVHHQRPDGAGSAKMRSYLCKPHARAHHKSRHRNSRRRTPGGQMRWIGRYFILLSGGMLAPLQLSSVNWSDPCMRDQCSDASQSQHPLKPSRLPPETRRFTGVAAGASGELDPISQLPCPRPWLKKRENREGCTIILCKAFGRGKAVATCRWSVQCPHSAPRALLVIAPIGLGHGPPRGHGPFTPECATITGAHLDACWGSRGMGIDTTSYVTIGNILPVLAFLFKQAPCFNMRY